MTKIFPVFSWKLVKSERKNKDIIFESQALACFAHSNFEAQHKPSSEKRQAKPQHHHALAQIHTHARTPNISSRSRSDYHLPCISHHHHSNLSNSSSLRDLRFFGFLVFFSGLRLLSAHCSLLLQSFESPSFGWMSVGVVC